MLKNFSCAQTVRQPNEPLSPLHDMLGKIRREKHASNLNRLLNHPEVYPWVRGQAEGPLDLTGAVIDPRNYLLMGQHGGLLFQCHSPGIYEVHSQCYPEGREAWMIQFVRGCLHWMFCRTDAVEILTRCPGSSPKRRWLG